LILSFVPAGISIYFLIIQQTRLAIELALSGVMLVFLLAELVLGYLAARYFVRLQNQRFYLQVANAANMAQLGMMDRDYGYSNAYGDGGAGDGGDGGEGDEED
jgi:hypothetical protein